MTTYLLIHSELGTPLTAQQRARQEQVRFKAAELFAQEVTPPQVARRLRVSRTRGPLAPNTTSGRLDAEGVQPVMVRRPDLRRSNVELVL